MAAVAVINLVKQGDRWFHGVHLLVAIAILTACSVDLLNSHRRKKYGDHKNRARGSNAPPATTMVARWTRLAHFLGFGVRAGLFSRQSSRLR